jgi:hypothetical protein
MAELPEPLTPADCNLRDFPFMPLDIQRLRRSKAWLKAKRNPALAFYMINLWTASWHEVPAASLEDDDEVLADLAVCDLDVWEQVKADVLRGWTKCSDGRLYHAVVAEKACESWKSKVDYRDRMKAARDAKAAKKSPKTDSATESMTGSNTESITGSDKGSITESVIDQSTGLKGQGQGQGQGEVNTLEANASVDSDAGAPDVDLLGNQVESQQSESESVALHCPVARIVSAYHELMPGNPKVKVLNDKRKRAIAARWREAAKLTCKPFGYSTVDEGLKAWRAFFAVCSQSDFLTGKAKAQPGKPPFIADIDFLTSPEAFAKCLENKYHREAA